MGTPPLRNAHEDEKCVICMEKPAQFPLEPPTRACTHESQVCTPCLRLLVDKALNDRCGVVRCPTLDCRNGFEKRDLQRWGSRQTFDRETSRSRGLTGIRGSTSKPGRSWPRADAESENNPFLCLSPACGHEVLRLGGSKYPRPILQLPC